MSKKTAIALLCVFSLAALSAQGGGEAAPPTAGQAPAPASASPSSDGGPSAPTQAELAAAAGRIKQLEAELAAVRRLADKAQAEAALVETRLAEAEKAARENEEELQEALARERKDREAEAAEAGQLQEDLFAAAETAGLERDAFAQRYDQAAAELAGLEARRGELQAALEALGQEKEGILAERDELAAKLAVLEASAARLDPAGLPGIDLRAYPRVLLSGFGSAKPRIGTWELKKLSARQTDGKEFFSRLEFPLEQSGQPYLYRFKAGSDGKGWVGVGLHLFASGVRSRRGYGEGRSLLVWLTRDPAVRKTDATWLQLYRSDNDVVMERVADAKLEEAVKDELLIEALYDPGTGYLTVAVDGRLALAYRAWFGIDEGVGVSLRSLGGGARFADFEVRTSP